MAADQEWCLECGAARTVIVSPPDWRIPVLVIGIVVLLVAGGFAYAISRLGASAGTITVIGNGAARTQTTSGTTIYAWDPGLDGYTVILASAGSKSAADSEAQKLATHLSDIGVLSTSQHPQMRPPGVWEVFEGRYASYALAAAAATKATHTGQPHARPALVQRPGQG